VQEKEMTRAPFQLGEGKPRVFSKNKRGICGQTVVLQFDREGLIDGVIEFNRRYHEYYNPWPYYWKNFYSKGYIMKCESCGYTGENKKEFCEVSIPVNSEDEYKYGQAYEVKRVCKTCINKILGDYK
jgi:hypothetical protein